MTWIRETTAVFVREWQTEWRTKAALSATFLFAVGSLTLIGLANELAKRNSLAPFDASVGATLLWVILMFTAATGLGRAFVQEEERGTALALRLCARGTVVWTGKFLANVVLLLGIAAIVTPTLIGMLETHVANPTLLLCIVLLGCVGIAGVLTTMSALVAQSSVGGGLLAVVSFPLLTPLLLAGLHGTQAAFGIGSKAGEMVSFAAGESDLKILVSFAVVSVAASLLLFDFLWND